MSRTFALFVVLLAADLTVAADSLAVPSGAPVQNTRDAKASFATLHQRGLDAVQKMQAGEEALKELADASARTAKEVQMVAARTDAIRWFHAALLRPYTEKQGDDADACRYYLSYLYYKARRFSEAAEFGESLFTQSPDFSVAKEAAEIAITANLIQWLEAASGPDKDALESKLRSLARRVSQRWPDGNATRILESLDAVRQ